MINSNMGCIETELEIVDLAAHPVINSNMGCIETLFPHLRCSGLRRLIVIWDVLKQKQPRICNLCSRINSNMGCIETESST